MFNAYKIETMQDLQHTNELTPLKLGSLEAELRTSKQVATALAQSAHA